MSALPVDSDVHLFCYCKCVIDLYSEVADRALDLCVPQQKLYGSQIPGTAIDHRRLGATKGMRSEQVRIQSNTGQPFR